MKRFYLYLLSLCLLTVNLHAELPQHVNEGLRLISEEATYLNQNCKMNIFGWGGSMMDSIKNLELTVEVPLDLDLEHSRVVFLTLLHDWIQKVNLDEKAKPFYKNTPMTIENFNFRMILPNFNYLSTKEEPQIAFIFNVGDKIIYCYRDRETKSLEPLLRESAQDGLVIANDVAKTLNKENKNVKKSYFKHFFR